MSACAEVVLLPDTLRVGVVGGVERSVADSGFRCSGCGEDAVRVAALLASDWRLGTSLGWLGALSVQ